MGLWQHRYVSYICSYICVAITGVGGIGIRICLKSKRTKVLRVQVPYPRPNYKTRTMKIYGPYLRKDGRKHILVSIVLCIERTDQINALIAKLEVVKLAKQSIFEKLRWQSSGYRLTN